VPFAVVAAGVNRASSLLGRKAGSAATTVGETAGKAVDTAVATVEAAAEDVTGATRAGVEKAQDGVESAAEQVLDLTGLDEQHEPFAAYSTLSGDSVMRHVNDSEDVEHLREILAYEQAHKARKGVLQALEARLTELSTTV
jgi:uncharacterized protein YjbJ (UPF0337 family)